MKISKNFFSTEKSTHISKNDTTRLLERGGFIVQNAAGFYTLLPLGFRIIQKIKSIIREELSSIDVEEIAMPVLQPARVWKESGRWKEAGEELWKVKNRSHEDFVLSMTGEELILDTLKNRLKSYKDLSVILNQIQTKIRDEARPRAGLIRLREFIMQDAYSFDKDKGGMQKSYDKVYRAYKKIFKRFGLSILTIQADTGAMGGDISHEFIVESDIGEDKIVKCSKCDYAANQNFADISVGVSDSLQKKKAEIEQIHTPNMKSALEVAEFLQIDPKQVIKTMVYISDKKMLLVMTRGDLEINLLKLQNLLGAKEVRPATSEEVDKAGLVAGFISPYKLTKKIRVISDQSLKFGNSFVTGANKRDYHMRGVNMQDIRVDVWADLTLARTGDPCSICGSKLKMTTAVELGHTFQLGTKYSKSQKINYIDEKGKESPIYMGSYGIGLERQMGVIAELYKDGDGVIWPKSVSPFDFYLLNVGEDQKAFDVANEIYEKYSQKFEIIFDDRTISAGQKFADADLIGIPYRITVSKRTLAKSSVEIKDRKTKEVEMIRIDKLAEKLSSLKE
ncbi:MAG: proline--tRNA ligase [bacterium]